MKEKLDNEPSLIPELFQISNGMKTYNALNVIRANLKEFQPVFCPSNLFSWDFDIFSKRLEPDFAEEKSNKRFMEVNTYKAFLDFTEESFKDGRNK